jgi:hypothetical protein
LPIFYKSAIDSAGFSSTTNTAVYTQLIPANTFVAGDVIRVTFRSKKTGTAGATTVRIYLNTTANLSGSPVLVGTASATNTLTFAQMNRHLAIKTATNNTEVVVPTVALNSDMINSSPTTLVVNWTTALYFVFAISNGNAGDTNFGSFYLIEKL